MDVFWQRCTGMVIAVDSCVVNIAGRADNRCIRLANVQSLLRCAFLLIERSYAHCKVTIWACNNDTNHYRNHCASFSHYTCNHSSVFKTFEMADICLVKKCRRVCNVKLPVIVLGVCYQLICNSAYHWHIHAEIVSHFCLFLNSLYFAFPYDERKTNLVHRYLVLNCWCFFIAAIHDV